MNHRGKRKGRTKSGLFGKPSDYGLADALGDPPPPELALGIGDATLGLFCVLVLGATLPNQFQRVKPKKSRISTSSAISAAAIPAPAPEVSPPVSTTSDPAGLQYRRTLYPPAPKSAASTITTRMMKSRVPKTAKTS